MAKKRTSLKGLGARYGIKLRKRYSIVHNTMKAKRKCPECGSFQFGSKSLEYGLVKNVVLR